MRAIALIFAFAVVVTALLPFVPSSGPGVEPTAGVSFILYGSISGWGFTRSTITFPGPTLTVNLGDTVTMNLFAADSTFHTWFVNYNPDAVPIVSDPGEPDSGLFRSSTTPLTFTFTADRAGTFQYWCEVHFGHMVGTFEVLAPNRAPTLTPLAANPSVATPGQLVTFESTAADADSDVLSYTLAFGDTLSTSGTTPAGGGKITGTHAYAAEGTYMAVLTVSDGKGGTASASTPVTVTVPIEVTIQAPWTQLYVGQTMDVTVTATLSGAPLPDAAVSATLAGGTLTPASGTTDADGVFKTVVRPSAGTGGTTITVDAVVSKAPYPDGSDAYPINVVPSPLPLSVAVTSKTTRMMSLETATIRVRLTSSGAGVTGGLLTTSSTPTGAFSAVTDHGGGDYSFGWTAPTVTGTTSALIRVSAKVGGYASPPLPSSYTITVDPNKTNVPLPTTLFALGLPDKTALRSGETILVRVYLYTIEGYPVTGASVVVTVLGGGTVTLVVDELNGLYTFRYTAPTVTGDLAVLLRVSGSKLGYRPIVRSIGLTVSP